MRNPWPKESGILRVVDTRSPEEINFGGAARHQPPYAEGWHVTDDPRRVMALLKSGKQLFKTYGKDRLAEYGGGLYISAVPQIWSARAPNKYLFLQRLTQPQKERLAKALLDALREMHPGYISTREFEKGVQLLDHYLNDIIGPEALTNLNYQPYNIPYWKADFLEPLGIEPSKPPEEILVLVQGRFAEADVVKLSWEMVRHLRKHGIDGAFVKSGWSTVPQMCIWNSKAIKQFGDWARR
jgi:hypothetical protein